MLGAKQAMAPVPGTLCRVSTLCAVLSRLCAVLNTLCAMLNTLCAMLAHSAPCSHTLDRVLHAFGFTHTRPLAMGSEISQIVESLFPIKSDDGRLTRLKALLHDETVRTVETFPIR